jgi:hypothetical protein
VILHCDDNSEKNTELGRRESVWEWRHKLGSSENGFMSGLPEASHATHAAFQKKSYELN